MGVCFMMLLVLLITHTTIAQTFIPNSNGYVENPKFKEMISQHGYQLVGRFDTIQKKPLIIGANAIKDGKSIMIDPQGHILPQTNRTVYKSYTPSDVRLSSNSSADISIDAPLEDKNELYETATQNGKIGTQNKATKKAGLPAIYDGLSWLGNGMVTFTKDGNVGLARIDGTILLTPKYKQINILHDADKSKPTFYEVWDGHYFGLINSSCKEVVPLQYGGIYGCDHCDISDNLLNVYTTNGKRGIITKQGKEILPLIYKEIRPLGSNIFLIKLNAKVGLADTTGKILIEPSLTYITYDRKSDQLQLSADFKQGIADKKGNIIFPAIYDEIHPIKDGLAIVELGGKYGVANKNGKMIIDPVYQHLFYTNNYLFAKNDGKFGVLDLQGKVLLPIKYDLLDYAKPNIFFKDNMTFGLMNVKGKILMKFDYESVDFENGYFIITKSGKYGVLNLQGKLLIPIKYDRILGNTYFLNNGIASAILNGQNWLVDLYGNELVQ